MYFQLPVEDEERYINSTIDSVNRTHSFIDLPYVESKVPVVRLRIYHAKDLKNNSDPAYYMQQVPDLISRLKIERPSYIFLKRSKCQTKVLEESLQSLAQFIESKKEGFTRIAKIFQHHNVLNQPCFDVICAGYNQTIPKNQINLSTFIHLRQNSFNRMTLKTDDVVKFGKEVYRVTIVDDQFQPNFQQDSQIKSQPYYLDGMCRVCLSSTQQIDNYIINPCNCSGSCAFIHIECLRNWLGYRMIKYTKPKVTAYNLEVFQCQICKANLPKYLRINERTVQLLPVRLKSQSFIILEKYCEKKSIAYVIPYSEGRPVSLTIGRSEQNDIVMKDISISRNHALLNIYAGGGVQISDSASRFGTFVCLRRNIHNLENITLSNNRFVYSFSLDNII